MLKIMDGEWTAMERVEIHLEAISAVRAEMSEAASRGAFIEFKAAGERLMVLEHCLVSETSRLTSHIANSA